MTRSDKDGSTQREEVERIAEAFFSLLATRYGLKSEDIPQLMDDMRWVREHRTNINRVGWTVALGILGVAASGLAMMLWQGFKSMVSAK